MIRIVRGPEPEALRAERDKRLSRAILARRSGQEVDFSGYACIKKELAEALHYKCAFCERDLRIEGTPVEHFRPKAYVLNKGEKVKDASRYWWLAWTWENLLFACDRCNTGYKQNQFPLKLGTPPLTALSFDTEPEQALLLDPSRADPFDHIRFCWSKTESRWIAYPINGSELGRKTISTLGLDQDDNLQRHYNVNLEPRLREIEGHIRRGNAEMLQETWAFMLDVLFAPAQACHAFTWDVLNDRFPEELRRRWDLTLPMLGQHEALPPMTPFTDRPELSTLPEELQLRVRALGLAASWDEVRSVFVDVSRLGPWPEAHLVAVFNREVSTIRAWQRRIGPTGI